MDADREAQREMNTIADEVQKWLDQNQADGGVCDFCARLTDPKTVRVFATRTAITGHMTAYDQRTQGAGTIDLDWGATWASCPVCAEVVKQGDPVVLAKHALDYRDVTRTGPFPRQARREIEEQLVKLYERLYDEGLAEIPFRDLSAAAATLLDGSNRRREMS